MIVNKRNFAEGVSATAKANLKRLVGQLECSEEVLILVKIETLVLSSLMRSRSNDITPELNEALQREIQAAFHSNSEKVPQRCTKEMRAGMSRHHETLRKGVTKFLVIGVHRVLPCLLRLSIGYLIESDLFSHGVVVLCEL
ncbi:phosphoenolpyruvate carboxylase 1-like isoform X2 [Syzygium oleosum]|uniref:phosphoenolpyruvate carboxylase 1-like isoform X2 n=1 Tax=Syzygium oleosum TaxID=219896 RepID=UPI0024BA9923|nr:phosphoenolpyruvate carboxylase 1-like isoform X2 [Syzygium oleosum]